MSRSWVLQLILRSINSSRSAYASISFINTFFDAYNIFGTAVVQAGVLAKVRHFHVPAHVCDGLPQFLHHEFYGQPDLCT